MCCLMRTSCSDNTAQNNCCFAVPKLPLPKDNRSVLVKTVDWSPGLDFFTVHLLLLFSIITVMSDVYGFVWMVSGADVINCY